MAPKAYIYSHIPKTGGTSLEHQLSNQRNYGTDFYHFYPRSRWNHPDILQFEVNLAQLKNQDVLLFGHNVNEGTIKLLPDHEIQLFTTLREPIKRILSQFNMVKSEGNFPGQSNDYIKHKGNFMCKWLVENFPSFTADIYTPIHEQAEEILRHFDAIYFAENSDADFHDFMTRMNCSYDHQKRTNVKPYSKQPHVWKEGEDLSLYFESDTKLYNKFFGKNDKDRKDVAREKILIHHLWFKRFIVAYFMQEKSVQMNMIKTLNNHHLTNFLISEDVDSNKNIFRWLNEIPEENLSSFELENIIDLVGYLQNKSKDKNLVTGIAKNRMAELFKRATIKAQHISLVDDLIWEEFPDDVKYKFLGLAQYYISINDYEKAIQQLEESCKRFKTLIPIFLNLGKAFEKIDNKQKAHECALKIKSLKEDHDWANRILNKNI